MAEADPVALYAQEARTVVIRPLPGGRAAAPSPAPPPKAPFLGAGEQFPTPSPFSDRFGKNQLLAAAVPILNLATLLQNPVPPADPGYAAGIKVLLDKQEGT